MEAKKSTLELSVVIPTIGKMDILHQTLQNLQKAKTGLNVEVIVVDDSKDGHVSLPDYSDVAVLKSGGRGASFARNTGWRAAKSHLLLFLDDDILVNRENLERTLSLHASSGKVGYNFFWHYPTELMDLVRKIKFGKYILKHQLHSNVHRIKQDIPDTGFIIENGLSSQYFSIERKWMEAVGGYDKIPFAGIEDLILYKKLKDIGVQIYLSPHDRIFQNEQNRLDVQSIVNRYRTGSFTRRIAVQMGHSDMGVQFSSIQKLLGAGRSIFDPILKLVISYCPYGLIYEKAINARLSIATYQGFVCDPFPEGFNSIKKESR